jgi:hypothetical protein
MTHAGGKNMGTKLLRRSAELPPADAACMASCRTAQGFDVPVDQDKAATPLQILFYYEEV